MKSDTTRLACKVQVQHHFITDVCSVLFLAKAFNIVVNVIDRTDISLEINLRQKLKTCSRKW